MSKWIFVFIIILACVLRFYQLGSNPPSLDWDEVSLGYNAYSILKTGADEYGTKWPLAFRSFDDYKPPAYVYLTVPSVAIFGLTEFAVRFASAVFGVLAVIATYFLVRELLNHRTALLASFLLAISPWHLQFSRAAFEANIGLTFFIGGVLFLLKGLRNGKLLLLSILLFVFSLYSYHSLRLVIPVFLFGLTCSFRKEFWEQKKYFMISLLLGFVLCLPLLLSFVSERSGGLRFSSVTTLRPEGTLDNSIRQLQFDIQRNDLLGKLLHNRRLVYAFTAAKGYLDHWDFNFLFLTGDGIERHHASNMGMLYFIELPFLLFGIYRLLQNRGKGALLVFWWFLVAPLASAITSGTPHPVRALVYLPTFQVFTAIGLISFVIIIENIKYKIAKIHIKYFVFSLCFVFFLLNVFYYLHQYYVHTPVESSDSWQYGHKEVVETISQIEAKYDKIIVTYRYDQPYIFFLFYNRVDPSWYQKHWDYVGNGTVERDRRVFGKYEFRNINWGEDQKLHNALIIGTPDEITKEVSGLDEILFLDGSVAFRMVERK